MSKVFSITKGLENMGALRTGGQGSVYKGRRMGPVISAVKLLPTPIHTEDNDDKNFRNFPRLKQFSTRVLECREVKKNATPLRLLVLSKGPLPAVGQSLEQAFPA